MKKKQLISVLKSQGIITQNDTNQLIMSSEVSNLLNLLKQDWTCDSNLESGGAFLNDLADIYFIYNTDIYDATTALNEAKRILIK